MILEKTWSATDLLTPRRKELEGDELVKHLNRETSEARMRSLLLRPLQILPGWELGNFLLLLLLLFPLLLLLVSRFALSSLVLEAGTIVVGSVAPAEVDDGGMMVVLVFFFVSDLPFERARGD